jgi:Phosphotransferase enzyme family
VWINLIDTMIDVEDEEKTRRRRRKQSSRSYVAAVLAACRRQDRGNAQTPTTSIPIPKVLGAGDCVVGPYIVMDFVEGRLLSEYLIVPSSGTERDVLDQNISISTLRRAYRGMAGILIELSKCQFSRIGAITQDEPGAWSVNKRALTFNMNELVALGNYPPKELLQQSYSTAADYFEALAKEHMRHLITQRNDAVDDEADCKKKFVARCLFLRIMQRFSTTHRYGPFKLFCDDLRPSNVIVDADFNVRGVIDWEFCYSAPAEFTYAPPWWLLLAFPGSWETGLDDFYATYLSRLEIFLEALRECEDEAIAKGMLLEEQRLAGEMRDSLHNGHFWVCYAARSSYDFDDIYWKFIDPEYYGEFTSIEGRIELLSVQELDQLEKLVSLKAKQAKESGLSEYRTLREILSS